MSPAKTVHPLSYFAVVLSQMTSTLKDFDMSDTAALLEQAKADIEDKLAKDSESSALEDVRRTRRESGH